MDSQKGEGKCPVEKAECILIFFSDTV